MVNQIKQQAKNVPQLQKNIFHYGFCQMLYKKNLENVS